MPPTCMTISVSDCLSPVAPPPPQQGSPQWTSVGRSHNTEDITQLGFIYSSFFSSGVGQRVNKGTLYAVAGLLIAPRRLLHLLSRTPDLLWLPDENIVDRGSYTVPPFN